MGYFNSLIETSFYEAVDEKVIFSPYGNFGRTYYVTKEHVKDIKDFLKKFYIGTLILTVLLTVIFKFYGMIALIFLLPYYVLNIKKYIRHCEVAEKVTYRQRLLMMSNKLGLSTCVCLLIASCIMLLATIFVLTNASYLQGKIIGFIGIIYFGLGAIQSVAMIYMLIRSRTSKN